MLSIDFNNVSRSPIKKSFLEKIAKETIARSEVFGAQKINISLSFASVSEEEIAKLNKTYRRKNAPTDVLSFSEYKSRGAIYRAQNSDNKPKHDNSLFLGEIILCYNDIAEYSKKSKSDLKRELSKVVSHGVLHLLGFRHGKKMFRIQNH